MSSSDRVVVIITLDFIMSSFIYKIRRLKNNNIFETSKLVNIKPWQLFRCAANVWCAENDCSAIGLLRKNSLLPVRRNELPVAMACWNSDPEMLPLLTFSPEDPPVE